MQEEEREENVFVESLPYSSVRQLRAEYLAKVASTSQQQTRHQHRRGTVFGTRPTMSLPYIPEVDEERRASYHVESTSSYTATSTAVQPPPPPPLQSTPIIPPPPAEPPILHPHPPPSVPPPPPQPAPVNVQIKRVAANPSTPQTSLEDYPERLMSPPPTHQPRSILKGQQQQQYYSHHSTTTTTLTEQPSLPQLNPQQMHPRPSDRRTPTHFEDLSEEEKTRIMHENLQRHRNMRSGPNGPRPTNASNFNGPFFRLEQVSPQQQQQQQPRSQSVDPTVHFERHREYHLHQQQQHHHHEENLSRMREISASEIELNQHNFKDPSVVVWPPISENERRRPNSVMAKNIQDPERISEYQRQKRLEAEAMARKEQQQMISMTKQIRAMEIQQQRIYEQTHGVVSPIPIIDTNQYPNTLSPTYDTTSIHVQPPPPTPPLPIPQHSHDPPPPQPQNVQIFETRPISAMSDDIPTQQFSGPSWKRTYIVEKPKDVAKNEILTSEELLEKDQYDVDLLKRRETFVEKPEKIPHIQRMGRRWQPPPEKPYIWPTNMRRAMSVEPRDFTSPDDDGGDEYKWAPIVVDPGYKREEKNFTPVSSPPASPRRGHGVGPLDEPAKRQIRHVIQPSSDGSHRPKTVFKKERQTPSGGFYPHAPNAIKIVKKRAQSVQGLLSPTDPHVEIIQQRNYHRLDYENGNHQQAKLRRTSHGGSEQDLRQIQDLPDWEKIYELPPHSSQIVQKEIPRHVDVQRRLSKFEGSIQNLRAASSQQQLDINYPMPDYEQQQQQQQQRQKRVRNDSSASYRQQQQPLPPPPPPPPPQQQMSRRNSVASTRIESPIQPHHQSHHHHRQSRSDSRGMSRAASSIPLSPQPTLTPTIHHSQRPTTPGASRARNYINRATAPSPTPYSYDRARAYVPPALPPGYRDANKPPANADIDELSRIREELEKRDGRSKYRLVESDIVKSGPEPMPAGLKDQVRDLLESRNSVETTTTTNRGGDHDKSGYVTDVSTATWNFSTLDYSPRSVVSMNGARDDILKTVPPLRTKTPPPPMPAPLPKQPLYYTSTPNLRRSESSAAIIKIQDDKPRSIMKRRELESREQLLYPTMDTQVVKSYVRNASKPTVTETVQRFEETRRTEEVERRVQRREKKERRSRHHSSSRHNSGWEGQTGGYQEHRGGSLPRRTIIRESDRAMTEQEMDQVVRDAYKAADEARRESRNRSSSLSRGGNQYLPGGQETYYRHETTRRQQHNNYDDNFNRGIAHARYGSLSDSLRRGELKYIPNGEVRESFYRDGAGSRQHQHQHQQQHQQMHKSYSTRDVFNGGHEADRRSVSSYRRGSQQQISPFVEFPPTLPRRGTGGDYREDSYFRPVSKSRSYADWDDAGRAGFARDVRKYDDNIGRLEADFRDATLLMPMPNGNMKERDHRTEQLPGGYETYDKDRYANSGRRTGKDGRPVDFSEASQEFNYKREQTFDDRRRR